MSSYLLSGGPATRGQREDYIVRNNVEMQLTSSREDKRLL
jgi:hypothetical protein